MGYFLKLEGFNGKSYNARHLGEMELLSFSCRDNEVSVLKKRDEDSAKILTAIVDGQIFPTGKITDDSIHDGFNFAMSKVEINSYQSSGGTDGSVWENITLKFESKS